ncbi:NADPH-dependent FMN reductase, partial [Violaceomyces palustris]
LPTAEVSEAVIPVSVVDQEDYSDPEVKSFSRLVRSSRAVVVLTPQFNRGYPGNLKNLLDHLYHEWRSKPFLVFTYGGHGGGSCAQQLLTVLQAGLKAQVVSDPVAITLPEEYIRGDNRV